MLFSGTSFADIQRIMGLDVEANRRRSALFLLKLKEKRLLSQVAIDDIVEDTSAMFTRTFEAVKAGVREKLAEAGIDLTTVDIDGMISNISDPFNGLKTRHFQEKYFCQKLGLNVSAYNYRCLTL